MEQRRTKLNLASLLAISLFVVVTVWWLALKVIKPSGDNPDFLWAASYGSMALFGGLYALGTARRWGGLKSSLGKTIVFLGIGMLLAEFGQLVFSYYNIFKHVEVPYPSVADIGFFGNMIFYVFGGLVLMGVLSIKLMVKKSPLKLVVGVVLPLALLVGTYMLFLKGYVFTDVPRLQVLLDFGYPLGDVLYVSTALVSLLFVTGVIGGILRKPLMLLLFAFIVQYAADFNFLYQNYHLTWTNGGYGDYLYFFGYSVMVMALITLGASFRKLAGPQVPVSETPAVPATPVALGGQ